MPTTLALVIPAYDEEGSIGDVVFGFLGVRAALPAELLLDEVVVVDNGSKDATRRRAEERGATVVAEAKAGYGSACLRGLAYLATRAGGPPEVVVFADGDGSNDPRDLHRLVAPVAEGRVDLVIGARGQRADPGSLTFPQRFGNFLASRLMNALFGTRYTDLGPFRAVRWSSLARLGMCDPNYGWTVEMQLKAAKHRLRILEVQVGNHPRSAGRSKVSGTVRGVVGAGTKIIGTILRYR